MGSDGSRTARGAIRHESYADLVTRAQCAVICALLGAIAVGVFIIAFETNLSLLSNGFDIKQNARGIFMIGGAVVGFLLGMFAGPVRLPPPGSPLWPPPPKSPKSEPDDMG